MTRTVCRRQGGAAVVFSALLTLIWQVEILGSSLKKSFTAELIASSEPGWPQFRGLRRDGRSDEQGLLQSWPDEGLRKLWSAKELGQGFTSPIIVNGKIYITGDTADEFH